MTHLTAYPSIEVISQGLLILDSHFASWSALKVVKCRRLCFCLWLSRVLVHEQKNCCWVWKVDVKGERLLFIYGSQVLWIPYPKGCWIRKTYCKYFYFSIDMNDITFFFESHGMLLWFELGQGIFSLSTVKLHLKAFKTSNALQPIKSSH
jgi:hypothetical protein